MTNGHTVATIALQPVSLGNASTYKPAEEKTIFIVFDGTTMKYTRSLGTTARMQTKTSALLNHTALNFHIIGLLKADTISLVMSHNRVGDDTMISTIKVDTRRTTAVHFSRVMLTVTIHDQVLHTGIHDLVTSDDRKNRRSEAAISHHDVRIHRASERKIMLAGIKNSRTNAMKIALFTGSNVDTSTNGKTTRILDGDRGFAKISIGGDRRAELNVFFQYGLTGGSANSHAAAEVQ